MVGAAAVFLLVMWQSGWLALFSDPDQLRQTLVAMGPKGYVVFLAAFTLLQPLGVPGIGFVLGATYVWPKPIAFALSVAGSMTASTLGFAATRFVARDWVLARLPARLRPWEARLAREGLMTTVILRLIFLMNPFVNGLLGVSNVRFSTFLLGSFLGFVPALAVVVWVGDEALTQLRERPLAVAMATGTLLVVAALARALVRRRSRRAAVEPAPPPGS